MRFSNAKQIFALFSVPIALALASSDPRGNVLLSLISAGVSIGDLLNLIVLVGTKTDGRIPSDVRFDDHVLLSSLDFLLRLQFFLLLQLILLSLLFGLIRAKADCSVATDVRFDDFVNFSGGLAGFFDFVFGLFDRRRLISSTTDGSVTTDILTRRLVLFDLFFFVFRGLLLLTETLVRDESFEILFCIENTNPTLRREIFVSVK